MKKIVLRVAAFITLIALTIVIVPMNYYQNIKAEGGAVSDITNWTAVGGTFTETANGYELSKGGNAFAISDKKASSFTLEYDFSILEGDRGSVAYGLSRQNDSGNAWRGVEILKKSDNTAEVKAFIEYGPMTVNPTVINNVDWSSPLRIKFEFKADKKFDLYINGVKAVSGEDSEYEGGYVGLLTWETKALFNNIKFTGSNVEDGGAVSQIKNWTSVGGTITNKPDGYVLGRSYGRDNFAISDKNTGSFTFEADVKILSGEGQRATLAYSLASETNPGSWRGVELLKNSATTGQVKAFIAGQPEFIIAQLTDIDFNSAVNCKITMDESKKLTVYINGNKVGEGTDSGYEGGYIGLLTWNTKASFNNIKFTPGEEIVRDPTSYKETYRPQLHFSPAKNFMNDPNGLVFDPSNNTYHLYFQYNPYGMNIGNQVWGHAYSYDMINWVQADKNAIIQDDGLGAIFSGSAVVDENNTSGLFSDNQPGDSKLVAVFTHDGGDTSKGYEKQSIAYSKDHGVTWIKPTVAANGFTNPVLSNENNKWGRDFRDPKVFWYDGKWMMVIAGGHARIFTSPNLINWSEACDMGMDSECPDFFPLAVDGDSNNVKWVYTASGDWYIVGRLEKDNVVNGVQRYKFVAETERITYNGGPEVYATQSFFNDGTDLNRKIAISWLQDNTASQLTSDGKIWNGAMSLPHELKLKTVNGKVRLTAYPIEELKDNRYTEKLFTVTNKEVDKTDVNILSGVSGLKYDIEAVFTPKGATEFGFKLRKGIGEETIVKYNTATNQFTVDRNNSGKVMTGIHSMEMRPMSDGTVRMRIVMDTSIIEAFGNDGEAATSVYIFPNTKSLGMEFFTNGKVLVNSINIYDMKSIWGNDEENKEPEIYMSAQSSDVELGNNIIIEAGIYPSENKNIIWEVEDNTILEIVTKNGGTIELKGLKEGTCKITAKVEGTELSESIEIEVYEDNFKTNLGDLNFISGNWYKNSEGLKTDGTNGDVFALTNKSYGAFEFTADVYPNITGGCIGLVFGVTNTSMPSSGTWFGANIDTNGAGDATAKVFMNTNGSETWRITKSVPKSDEGYKLTVKVDESGKLMYYVNDILVGEREGLYKSGAIGLITYNSSGVFNNVFVEASGTEIPVPTESSPQTTPGTSPATSKTPSPGETGGNDVPKTGDMSIMFFIYLVLIAGAGLAAIKISKRKILNK